MRASATRSGSCGRFDLRQNAGLPPAYPEGVHIHGVVTMFKHILIPTDGSSTASKAIVAGVALAKEMGAMVTGYHAQEPLPAHIYGEGYIADKKIVADFESRSREYAERCVAEIGAAAKQAGVKFESMIVKAPVPYEGIIEAAKKAKCDAIFIASHGHRGLARLVLGSVTNKVLTHSDIPVLVFR